MSNPIIHVEIPVVDLERAKSFYESVFNLEMMYIEMEDDKMYMFGGDQTSHGVGGALLQSSGATPSADGSTLYFNCEDVAVNAAKVEGAGGQLIVPKTSLGEHGFFAMFIDTEGNKVGMHSQQ